MGVMQARPRARSASGEASPSLVAAGAGFHPEQSTGAENIYMNAAILGMTQEETEAKFEDIAASAEVGEFLDTPVGDSTWGCSPGSASRSRCTSDCDVFVAHEVLAVGRTSRSRRSA